MTQPHARRSPLAWLITAAVVLAVIGGALWACGR